MGLRSALKALFQTGDKPTSAQYAEVIDSLAHTTEDFDKMGGGLKSHSTVRTYVTDEAILVDGRIRISKFNQTGAYNPDNWTDFTSDVKSLGIPAWDPEEEITEPVQRTHQNAIYEATDSSQGIEPGVDPDWESYWVAVVYTEGGIIPVLTSGFVKFGRVYEYQGNDAPKGLYRAIPFEGGYDGGYKLSIGSFASDLAAEKWALVAIKETSGGGGYNTVTKAEFDALVAANGLVPGWIYLVIGAYTSPLYGTSWNILVTARTVNAISTSAWVSLGESLGEILVPCVVEDAAFGSLILYSGLPVGLLFLTANLVSAYAANPAYALGVDVIISSTTGNFFKCQVSAYDRSVLILNNVQAQNDGVTWKKGDFGTYKPQTSIDAGDDVFIPYSGEYTPGGAIKSNCYSLAPGICQYSIVNDRITISGVVSVIPTVSDHGVEFVIDLPISTSEFVTPTDASGLVTTNRPGESGLVLAETSTMTVRIKFYATTISETDVYFTVQAKIIPA
jgi:hypothetical protein